MESICTYIPSKEPMFLTLNSCGYGLAVDMMHFSHQISRHLKIKSATSTLPQAHCYKHTVTNTLSQANCHKHTVTRSWCFSNHRRISQFRSEGCCPHGLGILAHIGRVPPQKLKTMHLFYSSSRMISH